MPNKKVTRRDDSTTAMRNRARVEALFASIGEGAIATDDLGQIIRINQVALDMLGFSRAELMHRRLPDAIAATHEDGNHIDVSERPIIKVFLTGKPVRERTFYKRKDGSLFPIQLTVSPILVAKKPVGAIEVFRDLTLEAETDKMKSDFISVASHQLRTPLTAINIYTKMLEESLIGQLNGQQSLFIKTVLNSVERMNELISTLLSITRIEAGGIEVRTTSVRLRPLVQEILAEVESAIKDKKLTLSVEIKDVGSVETDDLLVKEIIANLLSNAVKYTPEGGSLKVKLDNRRNEVIFSVTDTGCGIPANDQKRIFTKFFRAGNALSQDANGTGLGLYLTKIVATHLGGDVWFDSVENRGSTFYFSLPRRGLSRKSGKIKLGK